MLKSILPDQAARTVERERALLAQIRDLAAGAGDRAAEERIDRLILNLDEMFLLVVVGEVKAGKSAFLNALLGADVCPEGPTPLTDRVWMLAYGERETEEPLEPHVVRKTLPLETLREMNVVDTPGTNAPLPEHQKITTAFLPRADIVFFVASIDRPLTGTELEFLKAIHGKWGKEVTCILSKKDLHTDADREQVLRYLKETFAEHLGYEPPLFAVSAREARAARAAGDEAALARSGFTAVEEFIRDNLSDDQRVRLKLRSPIGTALDTLRELTASVEAQRQILDRDFRGWHQIREDVEFFRAASPERAEQRLSHIAAEFDGLEARGRAYLRRTIRLRNFRLLSDPEAFRRSFEGEVVTDAPGRLEGLVDAAATWLAEETQTLWQHALDVFKTRVALDRYGDRLPGAAGLRFEDTRKRTLDEIVAGARQEMEGWSVEGECKRIRDVALEGARKALGVEAVAVGLGGLVAATLTSTVMGGLGLLVSVALAAAGLLILPRRREQALLRFEEGVRGTRDAVLQSLREAIRAESDRAAGAVLVAFDPFRDFYEARCAELEETAQRAVELRGEMERLGRELG